MPATITEQDKARLSLYQKLKTAMEINSKALATCAEKCGQTIDAILDGYSAEANRREAEMLGSLIEVINEHESLCRLAENVGGLEEE